MNALKFEINISGTWHELSPTFSNFKLKKVRDKSQIFIMRILASGDLNFSCSDYDLIIPFVGETIEGRLAETICNNVTIYNIEFEFDNSYDFYLKTIKGKVVIKDIYASLYIDGEMGEEHAITGHSFKLVDDDAGVVEVGVSSIDAQLSALFALTTNGEIIPNHTYTSSNYFLQPLKDFGYRFVDVAGAFDVLGLYFVKNNNLAGYEEELNNTLYQSLNEVLDFFRQTFFMGFYLKNISGTKTVFMKFFNDSTIFTNGIDLTIENNIYKQIEFLQTNKFSLITFNTFDFQSQEMGANSVYFGTKNVEFNNFSSERKIPLNFIADIDQKKYDTSKDYLIYLANEIKTINLSHYDKDFYNNWTHPFLFADGNFDDIEIESDTITENRLYFGDFSQFNGTITIKGDLYSTSGGDATLVIDGVLSSAFGPGSNTFSGAYSGQDIYIKTTSINTKKFRNFTVELYGIFEKINDDLGIKNLQLSTPFLIENFGAEMPKEIATIDGTDYSVHQSNKFQQQISFNYENTIDNLDEFELMKTSLGWLRVDEIERNYTNNDYSNLMVTLTGK